MKKWKKGLWALAVFCLCLSGCGTGEASVPEVQQVQGSADEEEPGEVLSESAADSGDEQAENTDKKPETIFDRIRQATEETVVRQQEPVKGIYVTGPLAGHENMEDLIQLVRDSELNAMVIDIKNDEGIVTYEMEESMVQEIGADVRYIADLPELVRRLKADDVYLIARIVAFKDPLLAVKRPDLCIQKKDGGVFTDKNGLAWVNPYRREVWDYVLAVAKQAVAVGFDEIQFDYIRFPTEITDEEGDYGEESLEKSKTDVITEFTAYAYETLSPLGVKVSADVFGTVIDNETDAWIVGQDYSAMAQHLDYICPMIYPSHYADGVYDLDHPDLQPYETIQAALQASSESLAKIPEYQKRAEVRPWLQDFTATWLDVYQTYGPEQLRQQIQAVYDSGCTEWLLWNAKCSYSAAGLLSPEEAWQEAREAEKAKQEGGEQTGQPQAEE